MAQKTLTAPLAVIKVGGIAIGKMRDVRVTETISRQPVKGIGQLSADELPAVDWAGSLSCSFFTIDLRISQIPGAINRNVQTIEQWTDTVLLQEDGVQIDILKKVKAQNLPDSAFPNGIPSAFQTFASILGCFLTREGFNISTGQISGRDVEMEYITPILFPQ